MVERKNILLATNSEYGQANVVLAVAYELLLQGEFNVHLASFPVLQGRVNHLLANLASKEASHLTFHALPGQTLTEAFASRGEDFGTPHRSGVRGSIESFGEMPNILAPWDGPEYIQGYNHCLELLEKLDPIVVVIDPILSQGLDACRQTSRQHIVLSPTSLKETAIYQQPRLAFIWKYPALGSGLPYPLSWLQMFLNIYINIRLILSLLTSPRIKQIESCRKQHSIKGLLPCLSPYQPQAQYICPALPEIDFPFFIPQNITTAGPILLPARPVYETDPELATWLQRGPTVLVNLGTHAKICSEDARELASGLRIVLDRCPNLQVLWKLKFKGSLDEIILSVLNKELASNQVRITPWLTADPHAILQTTQIICSVHHSGGNSFYEATGTGTPQVVLPLWYDCYDFASRVEYLGIGIRGNHKDAPHLDSEEFGLALGVIIDEGSERGRLIRERAKELGKACQSAGGRDAFDLYHLNEASSQSPKPLLTGPALPALGHALAGSTGAAISNVITYPLALIITRLQIQKQLRDRSTQAPLEEYKSIRDATEKIYNDEGGLSGLYTGVLQDTSKTIADSFLFFLAYNFIRQNRLRSRRPTVDSLSVVDELSVGFLAGAFSKFLTTPIANIVTRKQASAMLSGRRITMDTNPDSVRSIALQIRSEKGLLGFWSGYSASLVLTLNPSLTFFLFETFKRTLLPRRHRSDPPPQATFLLAAISKAIASTITYPFSLAKSRAQAASRSISHSNNEIKGIRDSASTKSPPATSTLQNYAPSNVFSTILYIAQNEGMGALYEGLGGEVLKGFFSNGITMLVKETVHKSIIQLYYLVLKLLKRYPNPGGTVISAKGQISAARDGFEKRADKLVDAAKDGVEMVLEKGRDAIGNVSTRLSSTKG